MRIEYVPTLGLQRALYDMPRDQARFTRYLDVMRGGTDDLALPLVAFNPMGRDHVADTLDRLIAAGADDAVRAACERGATELPGDLPTLRATLVLSDDVGGMWTHRRSTEFARRWGDDPMLKRGWTVALAWTSDDVSADALATEARGTLYRAAYRLRYGNPVNLRDVLLQEGFALRFAGQATRTGTWSAHALDDRLEVHDTPTLFAALYGDAAAEELGYPPLGLGPNAGSEIAMAMVVESGQTPVEWLRSA
jgi:hypothetical protein